MDNQAQSERGVHAATSGEAARIYARLFPCLAAVLLVFLVAKDTVLGKVIEGADPIRVEWGFRTLRSAKDSQDTPLVRTYGESADLIGKHLDGQLSAAREGEPPGQAPPTLTPEQLTGARKTQAAYTSLEFRGRLAIVILGIGALFLLAAGFLPRAELRDRLRLHLLGVGCLLVAMYWFRWCFDSVAGELAYASAGDYGYAASAIATLGGCVLLSLLYLGVYMGQRKRAAAE